VNNTLLLLRVWRSPCCRAHTASEGSLEAVEPFPGLAVAKSSRGKPSPDTITPIRLQEGCYPLRVSPRTPAQTRWAVCMKVDTASGGKSTRSLGAESEHSPSPPRPTRRSGKRPDRIFPRQAFTSNQTAHSRQ
jgi:hypothetical protein